MWKPVDTEFFFPLLPVSLVGLTGGGGIDRTVLEKLGCLVLSHSPGTPLDFLRILGQGNTAPRYMIISGHADPAGLWFGKFGKSVDSRQHEMLVDELLPPQAIRDHVNLPGCTILSGSCHGGTPELAKAYLAGGVAAYIGARKAVGFSLHVFLTHFFFCVIRKGMTDRCAWEAAVRAVDDDDTWSLSYWHSDGREERLERTPSGAPGESGR